MPAEEDNRAAAGILANLSGFIISASLAMLAVEGALFTFVFGSRDPGLPYFVASGVALVSFVLSIVSGGWGVTETAEQLGASNWNASAGQEWFSRQAGLAFLGLLCFGISAFLTGESRETEMQRSIVQLTSDLKSIQIGLESEKSANGGLLQELKGLSRRLDEVERSLKERVGKLESVYRDRSTTPPSNP